jgi:hypothetical protein
MNQCGDFVVPLSFSSVHIDICIFQTQPTQKAATSSSGKA